MNSHTFSVMVYASIALCGLWLAAAGRRPGSQVPTFSTVITAIMRTRSGRIGMMTGWVWLGLHFFGR